MKQATPLAQAQRLAQQLVTRFAPACARIEIAGSIRRQKPTVGDIEIVAIPKTRRPVFGEDKTHWGWTEMDLLLEQLDGNGIDINLGNKARGPDRKLVRFGFMSSTQTIHQVDLFLCTPAYWGMRLLLSTGSREFNTRIVTSISKGGLKPEHITMTNGAVFVSGEPVAVPEERDVFALWGIDWIDPPDRR